MKVELLEQLVAAQRARMRVAVATDLADGAQALWTGTQAHGDAALFAEVRTELEKALAQGTGGIIEAAGRRFFIELVSPSPRLMIIGAVHIAQALSVMAGLSGYDVTVIDPRASFATQARFPDIRVVVGWPDEVLGELGVDRQTAIVTLTHDAKIDDRALKAAVHSEAFYVGALGSRRTQAKRFERLRAAGVEESALARVHGPVGLNIGALTPGEIAISILAQMTATLRAARVAAKERAA